MKKRIIYKGIYFSITFLWVVSCYGQEGKDIQETYDSLSLKDLLNVKIVSVSKKAELLFDAPLSATVLTKETIRNSGANSIMEALRLVPGMIVREQSNGNYDIHLRGMDNVPPNAPFDGNSTTTLVMIDNRPIYNYLKGGTFWETLPVDLNDVEKIEVVRGPAAALYGPNAVSGVINIITRQPVKDGLYLIANAGQGSFQTYINNVSIGFASKKWNFIASGNSQHRDRTQISYFEFYRDRYIENPEYFVRLLADTVYNINEMYPDPGLSMQKYAGNVFFNYHPSENTSFSIKSGMQHSFGQSVSTDNGITPLTTVQSDSKYVDLTINTLGLTGQFVINNGTQKSNFNPGNKYDFTTLDANLEYNYTRGKFSLKPGLSYRSAIYDDTKYSDIINKSGIFNARGLITTQSASLRGEYKLINDKLRLVAGVAASKFNYPDSTYLSYQFAATYKLSKNHLLRAVVSRAPRSSTIYDTYIDQTIAYYPSGYKKYTRYAVENNKNLKLLTASMVEVGYRGKITPAFTFDIEIFDIKSSNYNTLVSNRTYLKMVGSDTLQIIPLTPLNLPLTLRQDGITLSLHYNWRKLTVSPFITIQQSRLKNYSAFSNTPDAPPSLIQPNPTENNIYSGMGYSSILRSTPVAFGGADMNYLITPKINFNISAYYYCNQTYYHATNVVFNDGIRGIDHIKAKLMLNSTINYEPVTGLHLSCSARNILNDNSREFFRADAVPFMLAGGINYEF